MLTQCLTTGLTITEASNQSACTTCLLLEILTVRVMLTVDTCESSSLFPVSRYGWDLSLDPLPRVRLCCSCMTPSQHAARLHGLPT